MMTIKFEVIVKLELSYNFENMEPSKRKPPRMSRFGTLGA